MGNKEVLISLLDFIKKSNGMSDKEISTTAGYHFSYISQRISKDEVSDKLIDKLKLKFSDALKGWQPPADADESEVNEDTVPYKSTRRTPMNDKLIVRDSMARLIESQVRVEARQTVMRNFLAEIYAKVLDTSATKVIHEMDEMEKIAVAKLKALLR